MICGSFPDPDMDQSAITVSQEESEIISDKWKKPELLKEFNSDQFVQATIPEFDPSCPG